MCIGRRFAELEIQVAVVKLLQKFRLEYHGEPVWAVVDMVYRPDRKIRMRFVPRGSEGFSNNR